MGRDSSVLAAKATWLMSCWRAPDLTRHASLKRTVGKVGNSSRGSPRSLKRERPHSRVMRCSPLEATLTGEGGSSRAISLSFLAGDRDGAWRLDVSADLRGDRDVEVRGGEADAALRGFDQEVGEYRESGLGRDRGGHRLEPFLELFARDRETHGGPKPWMWRTATGLLLNEGER